VGAALVGARDGGRATHPASATSISTALIIRVSVG
jgi:hypothetical protein